MIWVGRKTLVTPGGPITTTSTTTETINVPD